MINNNIWRLNFAPKYSCPVLPLAMIHPIKALDSCYFTKSTRYHKNGKRKAHITNPNDTNAPKNIHHALPDTHTNAENQQTHTKYTYSVHIERDNKAERGREPSSSGTWTWRKRNLKPAVLERTIF